MTGKTQTDPSINANLKSKCKSVTDKKEQCRNRHIPVSRYCWRHQDPTSWIIGTIIGVVFGALANVGVAVYQNKTPLLGVAFSSTEGGDPTILVCTISNRGRAEARDVFLSFNNMLPLDTKILASSELGVTLVESEAPPDPQNYPEQAKVQKAFAVRIPRIAASDTISFHLVTLNDDNRRAGKQMLRIREEGQRVLLAFIDRVSAGYPSEVKQWQKQAVFNAQMKNENFFSPGVLSYENGRQQIAILSETEQLANALNQDLYARYKKQFIEVFQGGPQFKAPVVRIKTASGDSTYALYPPYVSTYVDLSVPMQELLRQGASTVQVPVPKEY